MGVSDGLGGFMPNASTNILPYVPLAPLNIRPIRFVIADPDADGKDELIFMIGQQCYECWGYLLI